MQILYRTDLSSEGNDCYLNRSVALIEEFRIYYIISTLKVNGGWGSANQTVCVSDPYDDLNKAKAMYMRKGGKVK